MKKEDKIRKQVIDEVFDLFKKSFELIGIETFNSLLEEYENGNIDYEEVVERVQEFNDQFDLSEFLKKKGRSLKGESIKLGNSYYSSSGIISLGSDSYYNSEECTLKYRIILNPTTSEIIKLLYANITIFEFLEESDRDLEMNYLVDKLNLLGIRHINIR